MPDPYDSHTLSQRVLALGVGEQHPFATILDLNGGHQILLVTYSIPLKSSIIRCNDMIRFKPTQIPFVLKTHLFSFQDESYWNLPL